MNAEAKWNHIRDGSADHVDPTDLVGPRWTSRPLDQRLPGQTELYKLHNVTLIELARTNGSRVLADWIGLAMVLATQLEEATRVK